MPENDDVKELLENHRRHRSLYAKVAKKFNVDPSYVSRIVSGERTNEKIFGAVIAELRKLR